MSARLVPAGNRNNDNGALNNVGSNGNYWSSTVNGDNARNLNFNSGNANMNSNNRANGSSVRCLKDSLSNSPRRVAGRVAALSFKFFGDCYGR